MLDPNPPINDCVKARKTKATGGTNGWVPPFLAIVLCVVVVAGIAITANAMWNRTRSPIKCSDNKNILSLESDLTNNGTKLIRTLKNGECSRVNGAAFQASINALDGNPLASARSQFRLTTCTQSSTTTTTTTAPAGPVEICVAVTTGG